MSRTVWLAINVGLIIMAISAAWFAVNARQLARPMLATLGPVELPNENPPLPPAPFARTVGDDAGLLTARDLFSEPEMARLAAAEPTGPGRPTTRESLPTSRALTTPMVVPSIRPPSVGPELRMPGDDVRFRLTGVKPEVLQYFGSHLIPQSHRETDIEGAPGAVVPAPGYALPPKGNPRGAAAGLGRAPSAVAAPDPSESDADAAPAGTEAEADATATEIGDAADTLDGLILISVLRNRTGGGRAILITPQASTRAVTIGEEVVGWRVSTIGDDFINLRRGSQTRVLRMPK